MKAESALFAGSSGLGFQHMEGFVLFLATRFKEYGFQDSQDNMKSRPFLFLNMTDLYLSPVKN